LLLLFPDRTSQPMATHMNGKVNKTQCFGGLLLYLPLPLFHLKRWLSDHSNNSKAKASSSERWLLAAIKHWKQFQFVIATANSTICGRLSQKLPLDAYVRSLRLDPPSTKRGLEYGRLSAAGSYFLGQCANNGP
jgi:hypothetical protein